MTKAEAIITGWNGDRVGARGREFKLHEDLGYTRTAHDGSEKPVRVYLFTQQGHHFGLHCDNYWGDSVLWMDGKQIGNYEVNYEDLWPAIDRLAPVPEMSAHEEQRWQEFLYASGRENDSIEPISIGTCAHCGERVWTHDDPGECSHGVAHGQCMLDNGCPIA